MKLVSNWRAVLRNAWSVRLALLAAFLNGLSVTVYFATDALPVTPLWLAAVNGVLTFAVPLVRILDQANPKLKDVSDADQ